jgi:hypothetical protein
LGGSRVGRRLAARPLHQMGARQRRCPHSNLGQPPRSNPPVKPLLVSPQIVVFYIVAGAVFASLLLTAYVAVVLKKDDSTAGGWLSRWGGRAGGWARVFGRRAPPGLACAGRHRGVDSLPLVPAVTHPAPPHTPGSPPTHSTPQAGAAHAGDGDDHVLRGLGQVGAWGFGSGSGRAAHGAQAAGAG